MRSQHDLSRRELLALGGGTLPVACTGNLDVFVPATPRYAARSFPIGTLGVVLDPANPLANFTQEGGQGFAAAPGVLSLTDISTSDVITFFAGDPNAAPGVELDVVASFQVRSFSLANADSGVRLNINDGVENAVYLCCVVIDGERCLALAADTNFTDASNYPAFVVADWTAPISVRFRRTALGDAEIVEVNGAA